MTRILEVEWDHVDSPQIILSDSRVKLKLPQISMEAVGRYVVYAKAISFDIVKTDRILKGHFSSEGIVFTSYDDDGFPTPLSYSYDRLDELANLSSDKMPTPEIR